MNVIRVLSSGLFSTLQDGGRVHYRKYGVPVSGMMDAYSGRLANMLLNNPLDAPVIEIALQGPKLQFEGATAIALTGADLSASLNSMPIGLNRVIPIAAYDTLSFGKLISGSRCYLAVAGGFESEKILGSCSYYPGIADKGILTSNSVLKIKPFENPTAHHVSIKIDVGHLEGEIITVQKGPEYEMLSENQRSIIFENTFSVGSKNNRMGYQLEDTREDLKIEFSILTSITIPGTVQLTPAGNPIVLMRDCQTTGGYPRILQLTENAINRLAQKKVNDSVRFRLT